jgi:predicted short-subunit dehydrogenase-like oxidoreductase (DUF2520 family)
LTVPDRAIAEVARARAGELRRGQVVAHCSGALGLAALSPASARGAHVGSLHPLCAVPSPTASLAGAFASIDGDSRAASALARLAKEIGLTPFRLAPRRRALYHAAIAMASNGLVALADEAAGMLVACGVPKAKALDALVPLMRSALSGLERAGLPGALTGPIARGDTATVEAHLAALAKSRSLTAPLLYRALSATLVRLSSQLGQAPEEDLRRVLDALISGAPGRAPARPRSAAPRAAPAKRRPRRARGARG